MISEVYNVDCLEYMRTVPDNFFSLAIVDPPYGIKRSCIGKKKRWKYYKPKDWDERPPDKEYFDELFRISKNQMGNWYIRALTGLYESLHCTVPRYVNTVDISIRHKNRSICIFGYWSGMQNPEIMCWIPIWVVEAVGLRLTWADLTSVDVKKMRNISLFRKIVLTVS